MSQTAEPQPPRPASLHLRYSEAVFLAGYLRVLVEWDGRACVRLLQRRNVVGVFGAPPTGCLAFIALPLVTGELDAPVPVADRTISAGRLRDIIGDVTVRVDQDRIVQIPEAVTGPSELALLPPSDGWQASGSSTTRTVVEVVDQAVAQFKSRVPNTDVNPEIAEREADRIWSRPGWEGVPVRALHTAKSLGFLNNLDGQVSAARLPGWSRFSTSAGQVFTPDEVGTLSLRLLVD
ncbi:MAG: hypothetical protein ACOYD0_03970 [Candidatus Nanopelagicales bacterium]